MTAHTFTSIGTLTTPFGEKFGVPRQSLMMAAATGVLTLKPEPAWRTAVQDLERFSHVWLIWVFHKASGPWHPLIETPRVGEPKRGLFATRSPDRPNPIGMSVVKLDRVVADALNGPEIHVSGVDILDGTPVLDVKPYVPYVDAVSDANSGWLTSDIERYVVEFSPESLASIEGLQNTRHPHLRQLLVQMLELDPRPTSQRRAAPVGDPRSEGAPFAFRVLDLDVRWQIRGDRLYVVEVRC
jgi:tRNA-Thr(GGU) m(6)t(6)A37 methyltransferase TsaA